MSLRTSISRRPVVWRLVAGLAAAALLVTLVSVSALADAYKPFSVGVPTSISAGATSGVQVTVTNLNSPQSLGSVEIGLPTGFSFLHSGTNYGSVTTDPDSSTTSLSFDSSTGFVIVQNLNLQTNDSAVISLYGIQAPGCTPLNWNITAQQANQWSSGNNANYMTLTNGPLVSAGETGCHLVFTAQPADAGATQNLTATALTPLIPPATPVAVQVQDSSGNVVPAITNVALSLNAIYPNPNSGAALSGTTTVAASGGTATFNSFSINTSGRYSLSASASNTNIASATSSAFRIWDGAAACGSSGCSVPLSSGGEQVTVSSTSSSGAIGASLDIVTFDCSSTSPYNYGGIGAITGTHTTTWTSFDLNATKVTKLFIPYSILQNATDPLLEVHYMVCMSAPYQFPVAWTPSGPSSQLAQPDPTVSQAMTGSSTGWYRGLLPDCQDLVARGYSQVPGNHAPCVSSRVFGTNSSGVSGLTVTILAAAGDPMGR